jgi:signal transduction histidine kinase
MSPPHPIPAAPKSTEKEQFCPDFTRLIAQLPLFFYRGPFLPERPLHLVSSSAASLLGIDFPVSAASPLDFSSLVRESDRARVWRQITAGLASDNSFQVEYRLRHARGHWLAVWEQGQGIRDENGQLQGLEGCITDITLHATEERARRQCEFESFQLNKARSINVMACGVAHDFNNVIAGILGSAELIKMELEDQPHQGSHEFLQQIFTAGDRSRELIHQIKTFSQRPPVERHMVQLPPIITESAQLVRSIIPARLEIVNDPDREFPAIFADAAQIQQAIINLCTHSWHCMPEGRGRIEFKLALRELDGEALGRRPELGSSPYLCLSIADNGPGMSKSTLDRLFEPFAHRRANGKKSGLEMFTVQEIMNAHEGAIILESKPGEGTVFRLCFPLPS